MERAILLIQCPDKKGIVAKVSEFVFRNDGNIINSDQYSTDPEGGRFFMRLEFSFDARQNHRRDLENGLAELARSLDARWEIHYSDTVMNMGILASKSDHCLVDLLYRRRSGELRVSVPFVASNHEDLRAVVEQHGIAFHYLPVKKETRHAQEQEILNLATGATDFLVLARYMQILSNEFLSAYPHDIINIHHSFLPSFKGANPYQQAYDRGVKLIGATAHYVSAELDEGPIIEQLVERVTHKENIEDLRRKGRNLEKLALANAIHAHLQHRIIRFKNKTIVFA
ncbi:MAG: formyltetrahydrofolate deformylase [Candidatus Hydrogenedentes bacterium]|nr:formyltetrahydrofolate deformylase [Candidatus Hydrogenedentota bacterium]